MNAYKFEEALRKINATRGFLSLLCVASTEPGELCNFEQYYDLFDFIETTCGAGLEELEGMLRAEEQSRANEPLNPTGTKKRGGAI